MPCDGVLLSVWLRGLQDGREMAAMAREELPELVAEAAELKEALKVHLLPRDEADDRSVILEVRAGAGERTMCAFRCDVASGGAHRAKQGRKGRSAYVCLTLARPACVRRR